jgi:hypothetical protein
MHLTRKTHSFILLLLLGVPMAVGCTSSTSSTNNSTGGQTGGASASGGTTNAGGQPTGGSQSGGAGGSFSTGGVATGGSIAPGGAGGQGAGPAGGNTQTGGTTRSGGITRTGGITTTGGNTAAGGAIVDGGMIAGGGITATGGGTATGGVIVDGGMIAGGGITATGGKTATGGTTIDGGIAAGGGITTTGGSTTTGGTFIDGGSTTAGGSTADGGAATTGWATIHNDFFWYDTDGNLINVRSGALRKFGDLYYWYGGAPNDHNQTCYSSPDLVHWTYKGIVLTTTGDANRMDILYNATTKQYVIFLKYIGNGAYFGIATGSTPDGQFTFKSQTLVDGFVIGDMSMYQDDDGTAYLAYVWWGTGTNKAHGIYRLSADYLTLDKQMYLWNQGSREAPHMFKRNGVYYYGVSETNGIQPSATRYYTATNLTGPWTAEAMVTTPGSTTTYETQCDFVFPFTGAQGTVYMLDADRWIPTAGFQGDYLWLPFEFNTGLIPEMDYYQDWDLNAAAGTWRAFDRTTRDLALGKTATASSTNGANAAAGVTKATTYQNYTATRWESAATDTEWIMVDLSSAMEINRVILKWYTDYGKSFKIQVSTDNTTWTDVYSTTTGASYSVTDVSFAKTTARYVRMNGTKRGNANGYSLFAFMVLNDP